jgi:hypothetical protein
MSSKMSDLRKLKQEHQVIEIFFGSHFLPRQSNAKCLHLIFGTGELLLNFVYCPLRLGLN